MKSIKLRSVCHAALFAALMAVSAWITVPTTPPFTLQTLMLFTSVGILGTKVSILSLAVYLALGAVGLPVFSGFRGGIAVLADISGGYLIGFVFAVLVSGMLIKCFGKKVLPLALSFAAGLTVCYIFGSAWYYILYTHTTGTVGIGAVLATAVLPFLPADAVKIALAVFLTRKLSKVITYEISC